MRSSADEMQRALKVIADTVAQLPKATTPASAAASAEAIVQALYLAGFTLAVAVRETPGSRPKNGAA